MPDPRIYQPTPLGDAPAPVPSWVQYEEEEKQRLRDEEAATRADAIRTREDARKTARDLLNLGATGDLPGVGRQPSTADIQQTWSENVDPTRVAEHPDRREDYNLDIVGSVLGAGQRVPRLNPETGEYESGEFQPHIPEPPFEKYEDLTVQGRMEHIFHGVGVAMEEDPDFADDVNLDINRALYRKIPILGSYQEAGESITLAQRSQNIVDGKGTKRDYFEIAKKMHNSRFWEEQATTGQRAAGNIANVGKYGVEFSMTAGTNVLAKEVGQELAKAVVKKTGIMNILRDMTKKTVKGLTGGQTGLKRAAIMGTPAGINTYAQQRFGPSNLEATEDGGYKMAEQKDSAITDGLEAAFMAQGELIIETLPLGKITAGVKNKFLKWFGQEVAEEVASIPKFRGVQYNAAIGSFLEEMGEERLTEVFNTFVTRDTANLGITGLQGDWQRDAMDEAIALSAPQAFFAAGKLGKRARSSRTVPDMPTAPPQLERTETPIPSWEQEIVPVVDTLADELPTESEVEAKIEALATDNLSSRREFEAVKLPDGSTLLDSYPSKVSREQLLEERRTEKQPVPLPESPVDDVPPLAELGEAEQDSALEGQLEPPVEDTPLAELREAESLTEEDYQSRLDANTQAELDRQSAAKAKAEPVTAEEALVKAPPLIEEEATEEDESTPEENAVAVEQIGKIDVMRVYPGRKVTEDGDGNFDVHFEGGRWRVLLKDKINLTKKQLTAIYNDYINTGGKFRTNPMGGKDQTFQQAYPTVEDFLKDNNVTAKGTVRASTDAERDADATWDVLGTIEVARGRGTDSQIKSLAHEAVHSAHLSGLWTDKEWSALVKAYSPNSTNVRQQSEDIANASQDDKTAWEDPGFMDRMVDWMNRMLSKIGLKELSPRAAQNMFFRSSLFNRQADTSGRVDKVPSDQAPMAMAESDIDPVKPRTLRHSDAKFGDPDYMDALVYEILLDDKQYDVANRHYDKMTKEANDRADAERKAKGLAKKRKALPYYQMTREEFEETGEDLYHGTSRLFDEFDWEKAKTRTGGSQKELSDFKSKQTGTEGNLSRFYFTNNKRVAETFAHETGGMIEASLTANIENDQRRHGNSEWDLDEGEYESEAEVLTAYKAAIRKAMKAKNFDLKYINEDGELVDAEDPDNIEDWLWWEGSSIRLYPSGNKPRVIETKVYGRTLDLRKGKKRPDNFPSKLENILGTLSYQHEYSPMLIKWARDNGYGKIRVEDHGTSGGESIIGLQEFIGHAADPHKEIVQRALNAGHDVPTEASSSYEGIQAEDGPIKFAMLDPDATDPGDPNPFPKAIEAGEKQLSIMEGIKKGLGDNAKPYHKSNVTRAKNRLAQLQIETRVEEEFNRDGKTAGYKWTEDPSKYEQVSVEDRESAEERVENKITPKIPDEPIEDLDLEMDWRGKPVQDPETRIKQAVPVPPHLNRPYLDADRKPQDVIHHKDARATVAKYRTGTVEEVKAKDDAFIDEFLTGEKYVDIHTSIYAIKLSEELQLTGKIEDFEMAHAIGQRYRDINADSSRITAYGKHVGSALDQRHSRLREAIFERDKKTLALISLQKSKDPLEAAAGAKAWNKEQDRIAAVREVVEDMGYAWTENGLREIVKNRGDQQKIVYAALYSKKGNFQRVLEINSEYTIGAMLSGTNTLFTNFISGPATAGALAITRRAESVANSIYNQTDITMSDYGLAKELKKLGIKEFELSQIIKDSFDNGITRWLHEYGPLEESMGINEVQQFEVSPGMPGKTGRVIRKVLGLGPMAASDQLTKTFYTTLNVRLHAAHLARVEALKYNKRNPDKEKLTDKDIKARATELLINRESPAWAAALQDALEITYQDDGGIASKAIIDAALYAKNIGKGTPAAIFGKIAEQSALLFVRTPVRMFSQIAARTPVVGTPNVFAKMIANVHNGRPTFQGVNNQIVSQIGVLGLIRLLAMDDDDPLEGWFGLSGSGVGKKMKGLEYEAVPNNAVRLGKKWYKTSRIDPLDILLSTVIDGVKSAQKGRGVGQIIEDASNSAMTSILDKSMVRSVASIIDAAKPEGRGKKGWMESYLTRYIPGLYSQAARHLDENIYDSKTDSSLDNILIKSGIKKGENIIGLWGKNAKSDSKNLFLPDTRSAEMFKGNLAFQKWNDKNVDNKHQPMEFGDEYTDEDKSKVKFDGADKPKFQRAAGLLAYKLVDAFVPKIHAEAPDEVTLELINLLRKNAKKIVVAHYEKNGDFMVTNKNYEIDKMLTTINNSSLISEKSYQYDKQPTKKGGKYEDQPADMAKFNEKKASAKRYRDWLNENWVTIHGKIRQ